MKSPRGSLMLEVLLAVGIGGMFMSALLGFVLMSNASADRARENAQALWDAQEGLEALQTMSFSGLTTTTTGALTFASNQWTLATNGPQTLPDGMSRVVKVETVSRDNACLVVASGGTVDTDSKKLTSAVTWVDNNERSHTVTLSALRTNWESPTGTCFAATEAASVSFNVSGAVFSGGKQLRQVYFTNNSSKAVTIDKLMFTWDNGTQMDQVFMDTSKVWSTSGPGTPAGSITTGTTLDIQNFVLGAGATAELNKGQFSGPMTGVAMTLTVTFSDGSVWASPTFYPL